MTGTALGKKVTLALKRVNLAIGFVTVALLVEVGMRQRQPLVQAIGSSVLARCLRL